MPRATASRTQTAAPAPVATEASPVASVATSRSIGAGAPVEVEISEVFDSDTSIYTQFIMAHTVLDVRGSDGGVAVPAGSSVLLVNRGIGRDGKRSLADIGLNRIDVAGKTFKTADGVKDLAVAHFEEDSSKGAGHRSIHLEKASRITFKTSEAVQLR